MEERVNRNSLQFHLQNNRLRKRFHIFEDIYIQKMKYALTSKGIKSTI